MLLFRLGALLAVSSDTSLIVQASTGQTIYSDISTVFESEASQGRLSCVLASN
jgi:hypothetical protein